MRTISFKETHISQQPAIALLQQLGYTYLSPEEALELRGNLTSNVLLEPILRKQLSEINSIQVSNTKTALFSDQNIENGIEALRNVPMSEGFISGSEYVYDLLTSGKALEQSIDGDKKTFTLNYIDWKNPENNVFHVTEEYAVARTGTSDTYRPDIVLFVNGIPLCIIECKRPDIKNSLEQAVSQHLRNQQEDGIRPLYVYSALLLAVNTQDGLYATTGTSEKFWAKWREQFSDDLEERYQHKLQELLAGSGGSGNNGNSSGNGSSSNGVAGSRIPTEQDKYLYNLCRPERLLDMLFYFTIYEGGIKKIARYQQYFAIKKVMERIKGVQQGKRQGGVIWHTQGSGKSLTMVMLAQAIAADKTIRNPKIILVTDRTDLDRQITDVFKKCGISVKNASTGNNLVQLLESKSDAVITTIINKFETAVKRIKQPLTSENIFVLIDEGHRSQYGEMNIQMQKTLPNACFIAMTGTPLMKREKNTAARFGGLISPNYTVKQAVEDKAVVPLLYEGRVDVQSVHSDVIDKRFDDISEPLGEYQRADLKKKFNRADTLKQADPRIENIAWDISKHYRDNWQGTGFKAQLVCPSKKTAVRYKQYLDEIGIVSSEVLITAPDSREGEDSAYGEPTQQVKQFWKKMMDEHGTPAKYEKNLIHRFKNDDIPEIIIVVDKLTTGFDEPRNTVMYLDRSLKEHKLLQTIARVNRPKEGKDFGYIIDYYGVIQKLNDALELYSDDNYSGNYSNEYEVEELSDINELFNDVNVEIGKLPQKHSELWDIFKGVAKDFEAYSQLLRHEETRQLFYERLTAYASCLKIALSSMSFHKAVGEETLERYREDLKMFLRLRQAVQARYSDTIDYKKYEVQIQKLIDRHVESGEIKILVEQVDIFDKEDFAKELEKIMGKAAQADTIASRTAKHITEYLDTDPAFYKKFSDLLKETIALYEQGRIDEIEYLKKVTEIKEKILARTDSDIPAEIAGNNTARAYFGIITEVFRALLNSSDQITALNTALAMDKIIRKYIFDNGEPIVEWKSKLDLIGRMKIEMEDYLIDEIRELQGVPLSFDDMDNIINRSVEVAKLWLK